MFNKIYKFNYKCYLYYLSYKITNIKTIKDITYIIKNISFFYKNITSDNIINILNDCFEQYPLKEEKMRAISLLQQNYQMTNGIEDYCCFILWLSIIFSINNKKTLQNKYIC